MHTGPRGWEFRRRIGVRLLAAATALALAALAAGQPHYAPDRPLDMQHIGLDLTVDVPARRVEGRATLRMTPLRPVSAARLDAVDFDTHGVTLSVDGGPAVPVSFADDGQSIEVSFGQTAARGQALTLVVDYSVCNPRAGLHFVSTTGDEAAPADQVWSLGEASDNRYWIPCFDQPDERQTSELIVTVDEGYQVLSNGRLVSKNPAAEPGHVAYHWRQDRPHAAYLITLVVGRFRVQQETWGELPISFWVPESRAADIESTFGRTRQMLDYFSARIGVPYPWAQYAQVCCRGAPGGMENTSAATLDENMLHDAQAGSHDWVDAVLAHELAHQWFGDLVTCREWAHLWLNEGFASYFEVLWVGQEGGPDEFAYALHEKAEAALAGDRERPVVDRDYVNPGQLFDARAYTKGAWIVHMLRQELGEEDFWRVIRQYCTDFADQSVETTDLRRLAERVTGRSLERFFHDWTERPGHPVLEVVVDWNAEEHNAGVLIRQVQATMPSRAGMADEELFEFPLGVEFRLDPNQPPVTVTRRLTERVEQLVVPLSQRPTMVRTDPGQRVLMELRETKGRDLWLAQLTGDPNPIGRMRAAQALSAPPPQTGPELPTVIGQPGPVKRGVAGCAGPVVAALCRALQTEPFWAVQAEIARRLGDLGDPAAIEALRAAAEHADPKARPACAEALAQLTAVTTRPATSPAEAPAP